MKYNIYYGRNGEASKQELINSFDKMEHAEKFLFNFIKEHHPNCVYIRVTFISNAERQYDYGDYTKFYNIRNDDYYVKI